MTLRLVICVLNVSQVSESLVLFHHVMAAHFRRCFDLQSCEIGNIVMTPHHISFLKFQGGNGSSPVRGLPPVLRSPQNSHSAPGAIVSREEYLNVSMDPVMLIFINVAVFHSSGQTEQLLTHQPVFHRSHDEFKTAQQQKCPGNTCVTSNMLCSF